MEAFVISKILTLAIPVVLCHFTCGFSATSLEDTVPNSSPEDKIYIASDQIVLESRGMFAHFNDIWVRIDSLFTDQDGLFIKVGRKDDHYCEKYEVSCRNCDKCVNESYDICPYCKMPV